MDSSEFSNIIEGLAIKSFGFNNWQKVESIELQTHFSAFGLMPIGQVLANKLNRKVTTHSFSPQKGFVINNQSYVPKPKIYEADIYLSEDDLKSANEQSLKNNLF